MFYVELEYFLVEFFFGLGVVFVGDDEVFGFCCHGLFYRVWWCWGIICVIWCARVLGWGGVGKGLGVLVVG